MKLITVKDSTNFSIINEKTQTAQKDTKFGNLQNFLPQWATHFTDYNKIWLQGGDCGCHNIKISITTSPRFHFSM